MTRRPSFAAALLSLLAVAACSSGEQGGNDAPIAAAHGQLPAEAPAQLFVLGDSLSDVGNAAALADWLLDEPFLPEHTVGLCNPADIYIYGRACDDLFFRRSRVSDGAVAVEHLAAHLGVKLGPSFHTAPERPGEGTNYAVASAKAAGAELQDLGRQVDMLVLDHGPLLPTAALYVVMIGGNDAIDALQAAAATVGPGAAAGPSAAVDPDAAAAASAAIIAAAVDALETNVLRLIAFGARRLIVANVPDLAGLPIVRVRTAQLPDPHAALAAAAAISTSFNAALAARLDAVVADHPDVVLARFDLYSVVRAATAAAAASDRNVQDGCFDSETYRAAFTADRVFHPDCMPDAGGEARFADFFFWDGLHPTGAAHAAIGDALIGTYVASAAALNLARR